MTHSWAGRNIVGTRMFVLPNLKSAIIYNSVNTSTVCRQGPGLLSCVMGFKIPESFKMEFFKRSPLESNGTFLAPSAFRMHGHQGFATALRCSVVSFNISYLTLCNWTLNQPPGYLVSLAQTELDSSQEHTFKLIQYVSWFILDGSKRLADRSCPWEEHVARSSLWTVRAKSLMRRILLLQIQRLSKIIYGKGHFQTTHFASRNERKRQSLIINLHPTSHLPSFTRSSRSPPRSLRLPFQHPPIQRIALAHSP